MGPAARTWPSGRRTSPMGAILNALPDHLLHPAVAEGPQIDRAVQPDAALQAAPLRRPDPDVVAYIRTLAEPAYDPAKVLPVSAKREGPVQPIFFSHVIHAGAFQIDCQYCHTGARRTSAAGSRRWSAAWAATRSWPPRATPRSRSCTATGSARSPSRGCGCSRCPEYAKFVHKNHIQAGLPCQTCHGRIEAMEQVVRR